MDPFFALLAITYKKSLFILCLVPCIIFNMIKKGGTKQACAVCKYQRRKCEKNCKLARYFPADQPKTFQNVHRLFGVRSILKILSIVEDDKKDIAMNTVIFESGMRAKDPVHGCWGLIYRLQHQLQAAMEELRQVKQQLSFCQNQTQASELDRAMHNLGIYDEENQSNDFFVEIDGDAKPLIDHNLNCYSSSMLNNMPLGSSQGIPMQLQEIESISIQDLANHHVAFETVTDHYGNSYTEPKAKAVSDASSSNMESKDSEILATVTKIKHKSGASSSECMLQFDLPKMTG